MAETNITPAHVSQFDALRNPEYSNFCLFSCFMNGEPTTAICAVTRADQDFNISPLFVAVTPGMSLTDHDGVPADG